jgi:hypothetical protein
MNWGMLLNDLIDLFRTIDLADLMTPLGLIIWSSILLIPLKGTDRRCRISAATYSLFCVAAGIALLFALPQRFIKTPPIGSQMTLVFFMGSLAAVRWLFKIDFKKLFVREKLKEFDETDITNKFQGMEGVRTGGLKK